ncbi:MAG: uroporphyrinogen decarboxylase family protein [Verrucomicrobiae bacterium]
MSLKNDLPPTTQIQKRLEGIHARYRELHTNPEHCEPMVVLRMPAPSQPTCGQMLADPLVMLRAKLDGIRRHLAFEDDTAPAVRVEFGTAQIPAAFGCPLHLSELNPPACGGHILQNAEDVATLPMPTVTSGWFGKFEEWVAIWKENMPDWVKWVVPDVQSPFNSAHLIRGNDIFSDFYDAPESVECLLDKVTDYMIEVTHHVRKVMGAEPGWIHDWDCYWKGNARISNCSMQMISPELYRQYVLPRDRRYFDAIGGGRIHYCGKSRAVIEEFFAIPNISGLDVDSTIHDFWDVCEHAPKHLILTPTSGFRENSEELNRLLRGDWPAKRNIVVAVWVESIEPEAGRELVRKLRASIPR